MSRVLPILFNTDMVQAILDGRKTVTRRVVKYKYDNTVMKMRTDKYGSRLIEIQKNIEGETHGKLPDGRSWYKLLPYIEKNPPYKKGDILYVRETWSWEPCWDCGMDTEEHSCCDKFAHKIFNHDKKEYGCYVYRASFDNNAHPSSDVWHPSIHMPKEAARIWLKVTDVKVERLQDIDIRGCEKEGCWCGNNGDIFAFMGLWDSVIKKSSINLYGWNTNPWVWVIEFERCEKPEEL